MTTPDDNDFYSEPWLADEGAEDTERVAEVALRPETPMDFIGQNTVKTQLNLVPRAAKKRGDAMDHVFLVGPPGLGKTTLAMIIAVEMDGSLRLAFGSATSHAGDLAAMLSSLQEGDVLFINKIHHLTRPAEETLYLAVEDFQADVVAGKGPGATLTPLSLPQFTLVGATARAGLLPAPLRDRFGFTAHMELYETEDLSLIVKRFTALLGVCVTGETTREVVKCSWEVPRMTDRLLRRVTDLALTYGSEERGLEAAQATLKPLEADEMGPGRLDRDVLRTIVERFQGGPVEAGILAVSVGEEKEAVKEVVEPFLVRVGLLVRMQRGRTITARGYTHLGLPAPSGIYAESTLFPSL